MRVSKNAGIGTVAVSSFCLVICTCSPIASDSDETTFAFPRSGDSLITITRGVQSSTTFSGDQTTGIIDAIRTIEEDASISASFDENARPAAAEVESVNEPGRFEFATADDSTFDVVFTQDSGEALEVSDLTPVEASDSTFTPSGVKVRPRLQSLGNDGASDGTNVFECAAEAIDAFAQQRCIQDGFGDAPSLTILGSNVSQQAAAANGALLYCSAIIARLDLVDARLACDPDEDMTDATADEIDIEACEGRIQNAEEAASNLEAYAQAYIVHLIGEALATSFESQAELCSGIPSVSATFTLRNADTRENIHIFLSTEALVPSNRVTPGTETVREISNLTQGESISFEAGRSISPNLGSVECGQIIGNNTTFDVVWDGQQLTCERT